MEKEIQTTSTSKEKNIKILNHINHFVKLGQKLEENLEEIYKELKKLYKIS